MTLEDYLGDWVHIINMSELTKILGILEKEYKYKHIEPAQSLVFKAFHICSPRNLKIVFLGQDPYPQKGVATGVLFANSKETPELQLSPSLQVIKECIINPYREIISPINFDNTLESWGTTPGVLMINSALTVETNKVGSHTMLWRPFISTLLQNLSNWDTGIIYVLFGETARTFKPYIKGKFNTIIEVKHPAYYARMNEPMPREWFIQLNFTMKGLYGIEPIWYNT